MGDLGTFLYLNIGNFVPYANKMPARDRFSVNCMFSASRID